MGFDNAPREPIDLPAYYRNAKDGQIVCKVSPALWQSASR